VTHPLYVAFVWHQHQPLYKSRITDHYLLPWVRLHGTKDYLDLVLLLERYPKLHQTVNLVPSLILQLEDYAAGTAFDPYLVALLTPTEQLSNQQRWFILEHFFDAHHRTMIDPHPRYAQLYQQRQEKGAPWCWQNWRAEDFSDLLAWHNLAWFDPLFWDHPEIAEWMERGRGFTLGDRQRIYSKQREIIGQILPQHRRMQESGQIEVITSPYTHPILPLLADTQAGQVAVPGMQLPTTRFQWPADIDRHLDHAWKIYEQRFGCSPRGLWPSEQSVSPAMLPAVAKRGFEWLCSDEAVLGWTLQHFFHRDSQGNVAQPELLYQPYRLETPQGDLAIVFRDHRLSDLIGFAYSALPPQQAASDFVGHLAAIAEQLKSRQPEAGSTLERPWLVTIALDGENCWEFYDHDGIPFLSSLYQQLSDAPGLALVTVSEFLDQFPPQSSLPAAKLHSGSWVDGNFTTWIGDPIKNKAWEILTTARETLANHPEATEASNPGAWEALYAAEGSDWFWWFGEGHNSNHDHLFDQLFREHVAALYKALQEPIPEVLMHPLEPHKPPTDHQPQSFIHPAMDGRGDEQDWQRAGRMAVGGSRGTMHRSGVIQRLWYGVDHFNFYLRFDFLQGYQPGIDPPSELHLFWFYPGQVSHNSPIPLSQIPNQQPLNYLFHHHLQVNLGDRSIELQEAGENSQWHPRSHQVQLGLDHCLELSVPWANLGIEPDWSLRILAVLADQGQYKDFLPEQGLVPLQMP
jgi:alpha-amylase/alpha-mannosidase (GH57 family)